MQLDVGLSGAWDEAHRHGLPPPPSVADVLEIHAPAAAGKRAPARYMLAHGGMAPSAAADKEVSAKSELGTRNGAEARSIELFVKVSTARLQADAERRLTDKLVDAAEAACAFHGGRNT